MSISLIDSFDAREILVTGATGNVGRHVVDALLREGLPVRAAGRQPHRMTALWGARVTPVALDFRRPETFAPALKHVRAVFLLRPPEIADVQDTVNRFAQEAVKSGVEHVVFLSIPRNWANGSAPHFKIERALRSLPIPWTFLRAGFFAQNFGDAYQEDIVKDGRVVVPAGRGRVAFLDVRDAADLAALIFKAPATHVNRTYDLTGPEAVTFQEATALLSQILGRQVTYRPVSLWQSIGHLRWRRGCIWPKAIIVSLLHWGIKHRLARQVSPALERLLGRRPRSIADYLRDHAHLWAPSTSQAASQAPSQTWPPVGPGGAPALAVTLAAPSSTEARPAA